MMFNTPHGKSAAILVAALIAQGVVYHSWSKPEVTPLQKPLSAFPTQLGQWRMVQEGVVEKEVQDVLKADDLLTREYRASERPALNLFIAYFHSQRTGKGPHSPKNCLPGAGWSKVASDIVTVSVPGGSIEVNQYVVEKGQYKSMVVYWYQSHNRAIASEYWAKVHLVLDSIRYNRSDTALVRLVIPIAGDDLRTPGAVITEFINASFGEISNYFPAIS